MELRQLSYIEIADKVLMHFRNYELTNQYDAFITTGFNKAEVEDGKHERTIIEVIRIMRDDLKYIQETSGAGRGWSGKGWYLLTETGRQAKAAGGHFAYFKKLEEKAKRDAERQARKDQIEEVDLVMKQWTYKARYVPYMFSTLALAMSIAAYFKPGSKPPEIQSMQQEIQQLKGKMKKLDSLYQQDTLRRRGK